MRRFSARLLYADSSTSPWYQSCLWNGTVLRGSPGKGVVPVDAEKFFVQTSQVHLIYDLGKIMISLMRFAAVVEEGFDGSTMNQLMRMMHSIGGDLAEDSIKRHGEREDEDWQSCASDWRAVV